MQQAQPKITKGMIQKVMNSPDALMASSPFMWALMNKVRLAHGTFQLNGHWFLQDYMDDEHKITCLTKGTQMGFTEGEILRVCHGGVYKKYPQGVLYLFPSVDIAEDFSASRLNPLISYNPSLIGQYVKEVKKVSLVKLNGMDIYFRSASGTKKTESQETDEKSVKNIPVDRIIFDEFDEMSSDIVESAKGRLGHSTIKQQSYLANPTVPGYGIDKLWQKSDQLYWEIKCLACGKYTNMELEFPQSLKRIGPNKVIRACVHCGKEIHPMDGLWIAQYPGKDIRGRRISQLSSIYNDPTDILNQYEDPETDLVKFRRNVLGMADIEAENKLTKEDVLLCCQNGDENGYVNVGWPNTAIGIDVQKKYFHVVIGYPTPDKESYKVVFVNRIHSLNAIYDLCHKYRVKSGVMDAEPDSHTAREFQKNADFPVFLADYQERLKSPVKKDDDSGMITVRRSEMLDRSHSVVKKPGGLTIPRLCREVKQFAFEMSNEAKIIEEDGKTGYLHATYRKTGPNDYRHAFNYFLLACDNPAYVAKVSRRMIGNQTGKDADIKRNKRPDPLRNILKRKAA